MTPALRRKPELMLKTHHIDIIDVYEFCCPLIRGNILLIDLKPDLFRIFVLSRHVADCYYKTLNLRKLLFIAEQDPQ